MIINHISSSWLDIGRGSMSLVSILRYNGAIVKVFKKKCNYNA
jgi:hypothetical protein